MSIDLEHALQKLALRERHGEEPTTLEEIGRRLGLTHERVRQIQTESLRRLATTSGLKPLPR